MRRLKSWCDEEKERELQGHRRTVKNWKNKNSHVIKHETQLRT